MSTTSALTTPAASGGGHAGDDRVGGGSAVCEQHVDEHLGAVAVTELAAGLVPEAFVSVGERPRCPGPSERCR